MRRRWWGIVIGLLLLVVGKWVISRDREPGWIPATTGYIWHQTTGHAQFAILNGREVAIEFDASGSNKAALRRLDALNWKIAYPNCNGDGRPPRLFLIGEFSQKVYRNEEDYRLFYYGANAFKRFWDNLRGEDRRFDDLRRFRLRDWYIVAPFSVYIENPSDPTDLKMVRRRTLTKADFKFHVAEPSFRPQDYVRSSGPESKTSN